MRRLALMLALCLMTLCPAAALAGRPCVTPEQAAKLFNKDICVSAHVYDEVELGDGTTYLDTCSPDAPDAQCRFTIVSLPKDRGDVGELAKYRDMDVHIRGIVRPMHGRAGMELSSARQFHGGPPKFRPNPKLLRGFSGEEDRPPIRDPNLRPHGGQRAFMNSRDQEPLEKKASPR